MQATTKPLLDLTASDVMSTPVVTLPESMPLRDAAQLLLRNQIGGAPVVDATGKCVGVFSATDLLRRAEKRSDLTKLTASRLPISCPFWVQHKMSDGKEVSRCTLPAGVCPIQVKQQEPDGKDVVVCSQPHCVLVDWQMVEVEKLPDDEVRQFMTADPVTVQPEVSIRVLSRRMIDAHIHRLIVVDKEGKPLGIVASTDLLAALAYAGDKP